MRSAAVLLLLSGLLTVSSRPATAVGTPQNPPSNVAVLPARYTFPTGAGVLFFYVKPDRVSEFEGVITRVRHVLDTTSDPARRQQADGWRIYKSVDAPSGPVYVFVVDPANASADYDPIKLLGEALPVELPGLFAQLKDATVKVERMGLTKVR